MKISECAFCGSIKPIFQTIPKKGSQCEDCYRTLKKVGKSRNKKVSSEVDLIAKADKITSQLVRKMYKTGNNFIKCFTCGKILHFNEAECGHFIPRRHLKTRWLLDNLRPQCNHCNSRLHGNLEIFEEKLEKESPGIVEKLNNLTKDATHISEINLKEIIEEYKLLIRKLN